MPLRARHRLQHRMAQLAVGLCTTLSAAAFVMAKDESAEDLSLPPWGDALPAWARSARVKDGDQSIHQAPGGDAPRRGTAMRDALLPLYGSQAGPGCNGNWLLVGPSAWMCASDVELSPAAPLAAKHSAERSTPDGLPHRYFFAGPDGSFGYAKLEQAEQVEPDMTLEPGFAVAIVRERVVAGERYGLTNQGMWVPMRDFGRARLFAFHGADLPKVDVEAPIEPTIPVAWVVVDNAPLFTRRSGVFSFSAEKKARFQQVAWLEEHTSFQGSYARIDEQYWIRTRDVRHPTMVAAPSEADVAHGERWIDIELESQTLVAYEGLRPVFATIVSSGKSKVPGHPFETPPGTYRIWVKLLTSVMDNLEDENAGRYYRIEDVPYVQYFHKGVGLHAAFWHRSFGHVRSHGCVNLAPLDAQKLFWWTGPHLPAGWNAALPTQHDRGTLIRVR